jgi:hypothetical protein
MEQSMSALVPTPGLSYLVMDPTSFDGQDGLRAGANPGMTVGTDRFLECPVNLLLRSVLREIVLLYIAPGAGAPGAFVNKFVGGQYVYLAQANPLPLGPGQLVHRFTFNETIDGSASYSITCGRYGSNLFVQGLWVGYLPPPSPPTGFIAAAPIRRVLDTRVTGAKLHGNEERVVATGVPAHAAAAVINLTVTETEQAGFVAVFRADSTWSGYSNINWSSSGQNLANSVITATDPTGHLRIRGGVNPTHVVIDVQGHSA